MKTVRLGKTGLEVSRIGIGGIPIQRPTEDEAIRVIRRALDLGVTLIDTSLAYGPSEERIGKAIAGRRDQVIITTKTWALDKATALEHLELSLKNLCTDYIDLWQFHNISNLGEYKQVLGPDGAMEAAQEARQAGKIRHIGFSSHSLDVALKGVTWGHFEVILFPFNFVTSEAADELVPLAREHDVGFTAMKPFAGGMLVGTDAAGMAKDRKHAHRAGHAVLPALRILPALPAGSAHLFSDNHAHHVEGMAPRGFLYQKDGRRGEREELRSVWRVRGKVPIQPAHPRDDRREHRVLRAPGSRKYIISNNCVCTEAE
jgi:aryl-alcohol dehydrogenase-like predicted oxidoreductase